MRRSTAVTPRVITNGQYCHTFVYRYPPSLVINKVPRVPKSEKAPKMIPPLVLYFLATVLTMVMICRVIKRLLKLTTRKFTMLKVMKPQTPTRSAA